LEYQRKTKEASNKENTKNSLFVATQTEEEKSRKRRKRRRGGVVFSLKKEGSDRSPNNAIVDY